MAERRKNVLVTGASGGIGSALVRRLDADGWRVFAGVRSESAAGALTKDTAAVIPVELDITDESSIRAARHAVHSELGREGLDGLVNNAGVIVQGPLELVPVHALRRQFEVNVIGQIAVTQAFLPRLRAAQGRVVNVGAVSGRVTIPMLGPISASKTALESLTDALRMELMHQGVRVSIIEPGALETEIFAKAATAGEQDGYAGDEATQRLYVKAIEASTRALADARPGPVDSAVNAVKKALTARRPEARYVVGRDASQVMMLRHLPQRVRDRMLMSNLGLGPEAFASG
jgi:NAD(P)-dependent dehydrogenase (short-subunit alcohol dehydrogenase family)